jgi:hypothetical protein
MPKVEHHDSGEYVLYIPYVDTTSSATTVAAIPIPQSGKIVSVHGTEREAHGADDTDITFEIGGTSCVFQQPGSSANVLTIATVGTLIGNSDVAEFGNDDGANEAAMAEDGDLVAAGGLLEIITDAVGTGGRMSFAVVIRP